MNQTRVITHETEFPFGKYKGQTMKRLIEEQPNYLQWLNEQEFFRTKFSLFKDFIETSEIKKHMTFPFGKYKGQKVSNIKLTDQKYCKWLLEQHSIAEKFPIIVEFLQSE
jgi:uncharacterized protein (DUF3820 family)